jgi:hypothetical protein
MPTKITIADGSMYIEGCGLNRWDVCDDAIVSPGQDTISSVVVNHNSLPLSPGIDHSVNVFYGGTSGEAKLVIASETDRHVEKRTIRILGVHRIRYVPQGPKWLSRGDDVLYCEDPNVLIGRVIVDGSQVYKARMDTRCEVQVYIETAAKTIPKTKGLAAATQ